MSHYKKVQDLQTNLTSHTATWHNPIGGNSTKGMEDVVRKFVILTDIFIDNHLRVNAGACKNSNGPAADRGEKQATTQPGHIARQVAIWGIQRLHQRGGKSVVADCRC